MSESLCLKAAHSMSHIALREIRSRYGTGENDGRSPLKYHNASHAKHVLKAALQIAESMIRQEKIEEEEKPLVIIASVFHDFEQSAGTGNETRSALAAEAAMSQSKVFAKTEIETVKQMIMATKVTFHDSVLKQSVLSDHVLSQIIADADLNSLGQNFEVYWDQSQRLLQELSRKSRIGRREVINFCEKQIALLQNHEYYTGEANRFFPNKENNLIRTQEFTKELIQEEYKLTRVYAKPLRPA